MISIRGVSTGTALLALVLALPRAEAQTSLRERLGVERAVSELEGARDPRDRRRAAHFLGRYGASDRASEALASALVVEPDRDVRIEIADAIARRGTTLASAAIAERLTSAPDDERRALLRALGAAADATALEALAAELGSMPDGPLAADLLVAAGSPSVPALVLALEDASRRAPALDVLGRIGDPANAPHLEVHLTAEDVPVRSSAVRALAAVGDPNGALTALLRDADEAMAEVILRAFASTPHTRPAEVITLAEARLGAVEPGTRAGALLLLARSGAGAAEGALRAGLEDTPEVRAAVREALGASSDATFVPVARALASTSDPGTSPHTLALDFLARARGGAGVATLLELDAPAATLALALRRAPESPFRGEALAAIERGSIGVSRGLLVALAGGPRTLDVRSDDPLERAAAGACAWLADEIDRDRWLEALVAETDVAVFPWLAHAAVAHDVEVPADVLETWLDVPERRAESVGLVPAALGDATPRHRRSLVRAVAAALLSPEPRTRAAAAHTLARLDALDDASALEGLLDDTSLFVRIAAARALVRLEPTRAVEVVSAEARAAHDRATARALLDALKPTQSPEVLVLHVASTDATTTPWIEIRACDGSWLHVPVLSGGLVIVPDLPCSHVDADLVLPP